MNIGKRVAVARHQAGLSQEELAGKVGISRGHLAGIETVAQNVKSRLLERFSRVLGLPLSYFFGEENPELTEYAEKARKFDKLVSIIRNSGVIEGSVENNVVVSGNENHVVVNPEQQKIIEQLLTKTSEERELLIKILSLEEGKKQALLTAYSSYKKGGKFNRGKWKGKQ